MDTKIREQEDQIAPRLAVASMAMAVSGRFGMKAATRSPSVTPAARSPSAMRATCRRSSR